MKKAFTLAEVLITLGIIGIVAAMTLPSIIEKHQKLVTANKLKKFYTVMSQAIMLSEKDNEEFKYWMPTQSQVQKSEGLEEWYNMYLDKHIQSLNKKHLNDSRFFQVTFVDGSGFAGYISSTELIHFMYCTDIKYCGAERYDGRNSFLFTIAQNKFMASNIHQQGYTREKLLDACSKGNIDNAEESSKDRRHTCARLIQIDGWEIKPDYPWKQTMLEKK